MGRTKSKSWHQHGPLAGLVLQNQIKLLQDFTLSRYALSRDTTSHFVCLCHQGPNTSFILETVTIKRCALRKWLWEYCCFPHRLNSPLLSLGLQISSADFWPVVLVDRVYSVVSVIPREERRKLICCFLCIYLKPVKANTLYAVVFHACC